MEFHNAIIYIEFHIEGLCTWKKDIKKKKIVDCVTRGGKLSNGAKNRAEGYKVLSLS